MNSKVALFQQCITARYPFVHYNVLFLCTFCVFYCGNLYFFYVTLFSYYIIFMLHFLSCCTKDRQHNQKMTIHSAPWTCFTFILISYNTFVILYRFEWLIKWKGTNILFCWKIICLPTLEIFKTSMWIKFI